MNDRDLRLQQIPHAGAETLALQRTIDALAGMDSLEDFIPEVLRIVVETFEVHSAGYFEQTEDRIHLRFWLQNGRIYGPQEMPGLQGTDRDLMARMASGFNVPFEHLGADPRHRRHSSILHHPSATASPELHAFAVRMGWVWELNVPLLVGGVSEGTLVLERQVDLRFSEAEVSLAETLARQIALAMKISRVAQHEREIFLMREQAVAAAQRARELKLANEALRRSTGRLISLDDLGEFLDGILQEAIRAVGAVSGAVFLHRPGTASLHATAFVLRGQIIDIPHDPRVAVWRDPVPTTDNRPWQSICDGRDFWWVDYNDPLAGDWPQAGPWHRAQGHGLCVCIPLGHGPEILGFLGLAFDAAVLERPDTARLELAQVLTHQATLAVRMSACSSESRRAAVLDERARLAGEIHDSIAQSFIGIRMQLQCAVAGGADKDAIIGKALSLAGIGLQETRRAVHALRPWQLIGSRFEDALHVMAQEMLGDAVACTVSRSGEWTPLPVDVEGELFRILQEALNNVAKHSGARRVRIELSANPNGRSALLSDNGCGFETRLADPRGGFGLFSMRKRAAGIGAELLVISHPGKGTDVFVGLPHSRLQPD